MNEVVSLDSQSNPILRLVDVLMAAHHAQPDAYLAEGRWLAWAAHANAMARRLAGGLAAVDGVELLHPVQANEIFLKLPDATFERMKTAGFGFYPPRPSGDGSSVLRLVTAFDTDPADVDALIAAAGEG